MNLFFDQVRKLFGPLSQNQVDGLNVLLIATAMLPLRHRAYVLATAWHETGPASSKLHMTPREEIWGPSEAQKKYEGNMRLGNTLHGDGYRFRGRGYVQITGRANYAKASGVTRVDLVGRPDRATEPSIAAQIIVDGMKNGWFTGRRMGDFESFTDMRKVVNGTDRADTIAGYAVKFSSALEAMRTGTVSAPAVSAPPKFIVPPTINRAGRPPAPSKEKKMDLTQQGLRILLQFAAGTLVARGVMTEGMATEAVGAVMSLGSIGWWLYWNRKRAK